jgi:hypothetical protein
MGVEEPDSPRREALWDPPPQPGPERERHYAPGEGPPRTYSTRAKAILGVFVAVLYAVTMGINGDVLPGLVGGVLAGILVFLVLREVERQRRVRWRQRQHR